MLAGLAAGAVEAAVAVTPSETIKLVQQPGPDMRQYLTVLQD